MEREMRTKSLSTRLVKLEQQIQARDASVYVSHRDEQGNLILQYKNGRKIKFPLIDLRPYQLEVQHKLFVEGINRFFLVQPRRSGKEVLTWNMLIQGALTKPGLYIMIYPTNAAGKKILWNGAMTLPDGSSLRYIDMVPKELVKSINRQEMTIQLVNGSILQVLGADMDHNKLRGINARGAVFSEYAYSDPRVYRTLMPVFRQNGGWIILQTTYNNMNHAYRYMQEVKVNPKWYVREDSVETLKDEQGNRYVTDEMIEEDRKNGMPEWMILQEYYSVVQLNYETLYFAHEIHHINTSNRIVEGLIRTGEPVYTGWDIGINDSTAITMFQLDHNGKPVIINYIESRNHALEYYVQECRRFCNQHNLMLSTNFIPHDGQKRDFNTGKNTVDFGQELGEKFIVVPKPTSKINAIQAMRKMLYNCQFNKENTGRLIECLSNYSKEFDTKHEVYKDNPVHDWTSHGVDSFQTMTLALDANLVVQNMYNIVYYNQR